MRVKTRLILNALLGILLAILIGVVLQLSDTRISQANQTLTTATQLASTISNMRLVAFDYLLNHTDRALEQWQDTYAEVAASTTNAQYLPADEQAAVQDIHSQNAGTKPLLDMLVTDYHSPAGDPSLAALQTARDKQLTDQLLLKQQIMVTDSLQLGNIGQQHIRQAMLVSTRIIIGIVAVLLAATLVNMWFIAFSISRGLARLQRGAAVLAGGKLGYRMGVLTADEFGQLATSFNSMAAKLETTEQAKSEFVLLASHQLRMPLTAISWIVEELLHNPPSDQTEKQRQYIRQIYASDQRMIKLVDDLLNVVRIGFGSLAPEAKKVALADVLSDVIREVEPQIHHKHLELTKKIGKNLHPITSDPSWIRTIVQNLLSNAIKYSREHQAIAISLTQKGAGLTLSVKDAGIGIPADEQDKIFSKMFRGSNAKDFDSEGTGVGLYITRSMVTLIGGTVWFTSEEGKGSTFYVELPKDAAPPKQWHERPL